MGGLSVKKKEEMSLRKTAAFAGVFTESSHKSANPPAKETTDLTFEAIFACHLKSQALEL